MPTQQPPAPTPAPAATKYVMFEDANLLIECDLKREGQDLHDITALFTPRTGQITELNMQVAVQKYLKLQFFPPSSTTVAAQSVRSVTQVNIIYNSNRT
jgi:hypothetical protein